MIEKTIDVSGVPVKFRSSAAIPRLYRAKFGRDIFKDLAKLEKSYQGKKDKDGGFPVEDLEIFENVAYIMALHADKSVPASIEEWLDGFEMFSIDQVLPEILSRGGEHLKTEVSPKKSR